MGFRWVMEAKRRGATIIHVDPRFTRTSAVADLHVPIRAGADIAFLGGIVNYIYEHGRAFRDYVVNYTNAPAIVSEDFRDTEDSTGCSADGIPKEACTTRRAGSTRGRGPAVYDVRMTVAHDTRGQWDLRPGWPGL